MRGGVDRVLSDGIVIIGAARIGNHGFRLCQKREGPYRDEWRHELKIGYVRVSTPEQNAMWQTELMKGWTA